MVRECLTRTTTQGGRGVQCTAMLLALTLALLGSVCPGCTFLVSHLMMTTAKQQPFASLSQLWSPSLSMDKQANLEATICARGNEIFSTKELGADKNAVAPLVVHLLDLKAKLDPEAAQRQEDTKLKTNSEISSNPSKTKPKSKKKNSERTTHCRLCPTALRLGERSSPSGTTILCQ